MFTCIFDWFMLKLFKEKYSNLKEFLRQEEKGYWVVVRTPGSRSHFVLRKGATEYNPWPERYFDNIRECTTGVNYFGRFLGEYLSRKMIKKHRRMPGVNILPKITISEEIELLIETNRTELDGVLSKAKTVEASVGENAMTEITTRLSHLLLLIEKIKLTDLYSKHQSAPFDVWIDKPTLDEIVSKSISKLNDIKRSLTESD